jgi:hypothetical protein
MSIATRDWGRAVRQDNERERRERGNEVWKVDSESSQVACLLSITMDWYRSYHTDTYNKLTIYKQEARVKLFDN